MDFGRLFSRAWELSWSNKWLFLLGFLAALGAGASSQANYSFSAEDAPFMTPGQAEQLAAAILPIVLGLACAGLIVALILWLVRLAAQAGLIKAAVDLDAGSKTSFSQAFSDGLSFLPRFIGLNLLLYLPLILLVIVGTVLFFVGLGFSVASLFAGFEESASAGVASGLGILGLCGMLLACLVIPLWLLVIILYPFAQRSIVVANRGVFDSVRLGWRVLSDNIGNTLVLILLYFVIGLIYGLIVGLILLPIGLFFFAPAFDVLFSGNFDAGNALLIFVGLLIISLVGAVLQSLWVTFRSVSFTLAYEQFLASTLKITE